MKYVYYVSLHSFPIIVKCPVVAESENYWYIAPERCEEVLGDTPTLPGLLSKHSVFVCTTELDAYILVSQLLDDVRVQMMERLSQINKHLGDVMQTIFRLKE